MTEAIIYDHVRTPRGRGKAGRLAAYRVDAPFGGDGFEGDQGSQPSRSRCGRRRRDGLRRSGRRSGRRHRAHGRACGGLWRHGAGRADQPVLRVGPRFRQFRRRAGDERTARADDRRRRRIDEPRRHRRVGRRVAGGSVAGDPRLFHAAGRFRPTSSRQSTASRATTSTLTRSSRRSAPRRPGKTAGSRTRSRRSSTSMACRCWSMTSTCARTRTCSRWLR